MGETQTARRALEVEVDTNLETETKLVAGIKTPLDIMSITLRIRRESNQEGLSEQEASATPPPVFRIRKWTLGIRVLLVKEPWV